MAATDTPIETLDQGTLPPSTIMPAAAEASLGETLMFQLFPRLSRLPVKAFATTLPQYELTTAFTSPLLYTPQVSAAAS